MELPLVLATANPDKAREMCEILGETTDRAIGALAIGAGADGRTVAFLVDEPTRLADAARRVPVITEPPDVEETGETLEENARIKARALVGALGLPALADDTGLEVDALGGAPGVRSARYAGEHATGEENVERLLAALAGVPRRERRARFVTVALTRWPDGREVAARGEVEGWVLDAPRGDGGFGYDPVFVPLDADGRTFAEMEPDEKHARSHRGRALRALASALAEDAR
jgi:XTP/dITP diphosphohydrolase